MKTIDFNDYAIKDLSISFWFEDHFYQFNVNDMKRDLTDGGGNPIFTAMCFDERGRTGTVNLTADWRVKSLFMN